MKPFGSGEIPPHDVQVFIEFKKCDTIQGQYVCFLNLSTFEVTWTKLIVARLLHAICGIKLKWEKHNATVVWGDGALCV